MHEFGVKKGSQSPYYDLGSNDIFLLAEFGRKGREAYAQRAAGNIFLETVMT